MDVSLAGIGTTVPDHYVDQSSAVHMALGLINRDTTDGWHVEEIYRSSGIAKRHSVLLEGIERQSNQQTFFPRLDPDVDLTQHHGPGTAARMDRYYRDAVPLATEACRQAIVNAKIDPSTIDHLITVTCTGFIAPGVDCALIDQLELRRDVSRTQVGFMGCHGAFNGLRVARSMVGADLDTTALVCAVELCTLHFDYGWEPNRVMADSLFADGAGAAVLRRPVKDDHHWRMSASGSTVVENTQGAMAWKIGDHGFDMSLSRRVPGHIAKNLRAWLDSWLTQHDLKLTDVKTWAVHPGGPSILHAVEEALELPRGELDVSREVLAEFGNMSSPTILFVIDRLRERGAPLPCVALGFGPGLTMEAMLFR